jgi:hypothetical protein
MCQVTVIVAFLPPADPCRPAFVRIDGYQPVIADRLPPPLPEKPFGTGFPVGIIPGSNPERLCRLFHVTLLLCSASNKELNFRFFPHLIGAALVFLAQNNQSAPALQTNLLSLT